MGNTLSESEKILNDIRTYLKITAVQSVRPIAAAVIDTLEKAQVFALLDGTTTQQAIVAKTKVPRRTIGSWLELFVESGLCAEPDQFHRSHRALFSLDELGLDLRNLRKRDRTTAREEPLVSSPESDSEEEEL